MCSRFKICAHGDDALRSFEESLGCIHLGSHQHSEPEGRRFSHHAIEVNHVGRTILKAANPPSPRHFAHHLDGNGGACDGGEVVGDHVQVTHCVFTLTKETQVLIGKL